MMDTMPPHIHEILTHATRQLLVEHEKWRHIDPYDADEPVTEMRSCNRFPPEEHRKRKKPSTRQGELPLDGNVSPGHRGKPNAEFGRFAFRSNWITPSGPGYSYLIAPRTQFGNQQSNPDRRVQIQINYMDYLATRVPDKSSLRRELRAKETLRKSLTKIAQETLELYGNERGLLVGPKSIDLKCFGSLRSGFSLPGADLNLAICARVSSFPEGLEMDYLLILGRAFLDAGFGARLVLDARDPILGLCEKPPSRLMNRLRSECEAWELRESRRGLETTSDSRRSSSNSSKSFERPPYRNYVHQPSHFRFPGSAGIQSEVRWSDALGLHSTELLRCYALCDERVQKVGIFVKMWAKARNICSPQYGTMCSYGYILMVVHYLMNVAQPPLVPNLQLICRRYPGRKSAATVNGHESQYYSDEASLRNTGRYSGNRQSVGDLLRGFFAYYGSRGRNAPLGGFDWINSTVSIRTQGGILPKLAKGWNRAKTDNNGNRLRYLLAIEDPFEHNNNVATSITNIGLDEIKAEFWRARTIIHRVQEIPGSGWEWRTRNGDIGEDFLAEFGDHPVCGRICMRTPDGPAQHQCRSQKRMCYATQTSTCCKQMDANHHSTSSQPQRKRSTFCSGTNPSVNPIFQPIGSNRAMRDQTHHRLDHPTDTDPTGVKAQLRKPRGYRSAASDQGSPCHYLIHPDGAAVKRQDQPGCRRNFRQQVTRAANTMRRMLDIQDAHGLLNFTHESTSQSVQGNTSAGLNSVDSKLSRVSQVAASTDEPSISNATLGPKALATPLQSHGVVFDSKQFHGPRAIRGRNLRQKPQDFQREHCNFDDDDQNSVVSNAALSNRSSFTGQEMLLALPFHEENNS